MSKEDLIHLSVATEGEGYSICLDDKKMHHVEDYKIEQATPSGTAMLTLKVLVQYP